MDNAPRNAGTDNPTDPRQDRPEMPMPPRIAAMILLAHLLATYGRYLARLMDQPALWRAFNTFARCFGTIAVPDILVRIQRGIMRAAALEALLLRWAERGRDLIVPAPRAQAAPAAPPAQAPKPRTARRLPTPDPLTQAEIEAEVRRRPIGRTIAAILLDLGVSPALCDGAFWDYHLFEAIQDYRGDIDAVVTEFRRREAQFDSDDWQRGGNRHWPERTRDGVRRILGCLIGEGWPPPALAALPGPS